jgi:hypothetical protein
LRCPDGWPKRGAHGKQATSYPGFDALPGDPGSAAVVQDGKVLTSRGSHHGFCAGMVEALAEPKRQQVEAALVRPGRPVSFIITLS